MFAGEPGAGAITICLTGPSDDEQSMLDPRALATAKPKIAAGIVAFDCWVLNPDRHPGNLAFSPRHGVVSMFDHGHSLLGTSAGQGEQYLEGCRDMAFWSGCLISELTRASDLRYWAERLASIHDDRVTEIAEAAAELGVCTSQEASKVGEILNHRKKRIGDYVDLGRASFPAVSDWTGGQP